MRVDPFAAGGCQRVEQLIGSQVMIHLRFGHCVLPTADFDRSQPRDGRAPAGHARCGNEPNRSIECILRGKSEQNSSWSRPSIVGQG
jgi:hypothetical protein